MSHTLQTENPRPGWPRGRPASCSTFSLRYAEGLPTSGGFDDRGSQRRRPPRTGQPRAGGGHGSSMRTHPHPCEEQRQLSAKCPPFEPILPLFKHDRLGHGLTARTADRAVPIRLRRFLAGIHAILETPDKREVGGSSPPGPKRAYKNSGRRFRRIIPANQCARPGPAALGDVGGDDTDATGIPANRLRLSR